MSLHIIKSHHESSKSLHQCLSFAQNDDVLLLIEDGVYSALQSTLSVNIKNPCYVLKADLEARGILNEIAAHFQIIDYDGFVELTEQHKKIISW